MATQEKINQINKALQISGAAITKGAKAEIVDGKILYSILRQNATCITKVRLSFKEILWYMNSPEAIAIEKAL